MSCNVAYSTGFKEEHVYEYIYDITPNVAYMSPDVTNDIITTSPNEAYIASPNTTPDVLNEPHATTDTFLGQ